MKRQWHIVVALGLLSSLVLAGTQTPPIPGEKVDEIPADTEIKTTPSGLKYSVLKVGTSDGARPKYGSKVKVHYTGWLTDGTKFDSSVDRGTPSEFALGQVIEGWNEGVELMSVGATYKFTIPWYLGYGERGNGRIPAKADLIFVVELLEVTPGPDFGEFIKSDPAAQKETDSGLKYEVAMAGEGDMIGKADGIHVAYTFWNAKGQIVDSSKLRPMPLKTPVSKLQIPFLQEGLLLMRKGSKFRFEVPPELCFKDTDRGPRCPPNSLTIWEVEILDVMKVPAFTPLNKDKSVTTASGLTYEVLKEGVGKRPTTADTCKVHYAGWQENGVCFDSSYGRGEPTVFRPDQVIKGWTEALLLMGEGAQWRLRIPTELAYGEAPPPGSGIEPNAVLIFQIELVKVGL